MATIIFQGFGEDANLYTTVLGISMPPNNDTKSITSSQLRKAYYRRALQYHPDKQAKKKTKEEKNDAKLKFQAVSVAYSILSNEEKRKVYDSTGEIDDPDNDDGLGGSSSSSNAQMWKDYFKGIFGTVTTKDIDQFTENYKCSEEEEKDVLKYYVKFQGNLDKMLECVMCSSEIDKPRWVEDYIKPAINDERVENHMTTIECTMGNNSTGEFDEAEADTETEESDESNEKSRTKKEKEDKQEKITIQEERKNTGRSGCSYSHKS